MVPADIGWSDVGSWSALWEVQSGDADGNVQRGDVYLDGARNCLVRAESRIVARAPSILPSWHWTLVSPTSERTKAGLRSRT